MDFHKDVLVKLLLFQVLNHEEIHRDRCDCICVWVTGCLGHPLPKCAFATRSENEGHGHVGNDRPGEGGSLYRLSRAP